MDITQLLSIELAEFSVNVLLNATGCFLLWKTYKKSQITTQKLLLLPFYLLFSRIQAKLMKNCIENDHILTQLGKVHIYKKHNELFLIPVF